MIRQRQRLLAFERRLRRGCALEHQFLNQRERLLEDRHALIGDPGAVPRHAGVARLVSRPRVRRPTSVLRNRLVARISLRSRRRNAPPLDGHDPSAGLCNRHFSGRVLGAIPVAGIAGGRAGHVSRVYM